MHDRRFRRLARAALRGPGESGADLVGGGCGNLIIFAFFYALVALLGAGRGSALLYAGLLWLLVLAIGWFVARRGAG